MKNNFKTENGKVFIWLKNINQYTVIDQCNFERANEFTGTWSGWLNKHTKSYYVIGSINVGNGKRSIMWLHRWILNINDSKIHIDHKNHDSLDCKIGNLSIVTNAENHQNLKLHQNKNTGITYIKKNKKWVSQITVNMKHIYLGSYDTSEEAKQAYDKARELYHKYGSNFNQKEINEVAI